jgi:hypothetical protein
MTVLDAVIVALVAFALGALAGDAIAWSNGR